MTVVRSDAAELRRQAAEARALATNLERQAAAAVAAALEASRPQMPPIGGESDPAIIRFSRYQSGREYNYAAIGWRQGRSIRWAVTGSEDRRFNWPGLLDFIGEANWASLYVMADHRQLLPPGGEPPVAETMGAFGRVRSTDPVHDGGPGY